MASSDPNEGIFSNIYFPKDKQVKLLIDG